jgi:hypothetical protein
MNILYSLFDVFSRGKRDPEYFNVSYYLAQPFIGIIFGVVTLLLVDAIFRLWSDSISLGAGRISFGFVLLPSMVAGYQQRAILRIIKRKVFRNWGRS